MKTVLRKVGCIASQHHSLRVQRFAAQNPSHVCPPATLSRCMWVASFVGELVMDTMRGYPEDRSAFKRKRATYRQKIFDPLGGLEAAMRQQPVVAHADSHIDGEHVQHRCGQYRFPGEEEECRNGSDVERNHKSGSDPAQLAALSGTTQSWRIWLGRMALGCFRGFSEERFFQKFDRHSARTSLIGGIDSRF